MSNVLQSDLRDRVVQAAEAVLERSGSVGPLELLQQMMLLNPVHFDGWRKGNSHYSSLEQSIQCGAKKLEQTYRFFAEWVRERGLQPIEASYVQAGPRGSETLRVTAGGDPERERFFRTHFAPADLPAKKAAKLKEKLAKAPELLVYQLINDSVCGECQAELFRGRLLFLEKGRPLCMSCADLDHLEFLSRGDAALTRRARKYSPLSAIVLWFSRSRKRYERQGILVTPEAIAEAEAECVEDAAERAAQREQGAARRRQQDRELIAAMTDYILASYPGCPAAEARGIAEHTAERGSGRVGRSAAGRALDARAIELAVVACVRHRHTNYDALLMRGVERIEAREMIGSQIDAVLRKWSERLA